MIRNTKQFSLLILCRNEQDSSRRFFQPSLSFCRPKIWPEDFRPDTCEKLSAGLNALLKVLLGRPFNSPMPVAAHHAIPALISIQLPGL
jgi:hypothetical protein